MEEKELDLEELENINALVNKEASYEDTMKNKDIFRKQQIEELQKLRDSIKPFEEVKKTSHR